jgi:hypothetical protein
MLLQLTGVRKWIADAPAVSSCCSSCFTPAADGDVIIGGTRGPFVNSEANPTHITSTAIARRRTEEFIAITTMTVTSPLMMTIVL